MLKRTIVILLGFICLLVALVFTNINGYLINQLAPIDKFPVVYRFLEGRSELEKLALMAGTIVILGLVAALMSWLVTKLPEWFTPKELSIASLESGRRMRLIKSQVAEVNDRLKDALERSAMIPLGFVDASAQVNQPALEALNPAVPVASTRGIFDRAMKFFPFRNRREVELPTQTKMIEVLRREDVSGRLLILGHPGAGKTTTLLELARELLMEAQEAGSKRIPHVFEMSRWEEGLDLVEYLALELKQIHNLDLAIGRGMAASGELLPLLDGLDELRDPAVISAAMGAINAYLVEGADRDAVVCCRVLDYGLASEQLRELNGAVELQPLSEVAIRRYLTDVGKGKLWALVEQNRGLVESNDPNILPLLKTPLFLSVFAAVSPIVAVKSEADLWDAYIVKQLGIPAEKLSGKGYKRYKGTEEPTQKQTKNYLIFLAQQLRRTNEVMLIEEMQPTWLGEHQKHKFNQLVGIIRGLIGGLTVGFLAGSLSVGIFFLIIMRRMYAFLNRSDEIEPIEEIRFAISQNIFLKGLPYLLGSITWGGGMSIFWGVKPGMTAGLIFGLFLSIIGCFQTTLRLRSVPNQGIKSSFKNVIILTPVSLVFSTTMLAILTPYIQKEMTTETLATFSRMLIIVVAYNVSIFGGGKAFIQHVSLRITLYLSHQKPNDSQTRCIPWNYARFLSYAADRKLLQQTGGAYRFIHRSLLEHFAEMEN